MHHNRGWILLRADYLSHDVHNKVNVCEAAHKGKVSGVVLREKHLLMINRQTKEIYLIVSMKAKTAKNLTNTKLKIIYC